MWCRKSITVCLLVLFVGNANGQRDLTDIPLPDPPAERNAMKVDPAAEVNLFAADPDIRKPIQMNFDSAGGLWVASSEVYPQIRPGEKSDDKIIVIRDTDGDGVGDQRTVFADGLLIPTGVIPDGPNAAYVAASTQLLYLQDTDGDGVSDQRRVVFSGFGTEDTHHLLHTLRWGPDGCLYFNQSIYIHSHIETAYGTRHLDGGGIWRYRPATGQLEVLCKGFVNPWGHVFDQYGESFATDGAYFEGINYVFPDSVFVTSPGATRWLKGLNPGSPKHCGLEILSGTHIPAEWSGDFVTNDFRSHRVCRFTVKPNGSGYISRQQPEIVTTEHVAFRPIDVRMGPDGAMYIADWYNPIIQHGEVDFRDDRRDRLHGRIWRVSFPGRELDPWPKFSGQTVADLLTQLEDPALPVRQFSRQELWRRAAAEPESVHNDFIRWRNAAADAERKSTRALEVLWIDEVIGTMPIADALAALGESSDASGATLRTAMRSVWRNCENLPHDSQQRAELTTMIASKTGHEDPRVRLEAVVSNGQLSSREAASRAIAAAEKPVDDNLNFALWQTMRKLQEHWVPGSLAGEVDWTGRESALAFAVSAVGTTQSAEIATRVLQQDASRGNINQSLVDAVAVAGNADQLGRVVKALLSGTLADRSPQRFAPLLARTERDGTIPAGAAELLTSVTPQPDMFLANQDWANTVTAAAAAWKIGELEGIFTQVLPKTSGPLRAKVINALGSFESESARQKVNELARSEDPETRVAATRAITSSRPRAAIPLIVNLLQSGQTGDAAADLVVSVLKRKELTDLIARSIDNDGLPTDRARSLLRRVRSSGGNAKLEDAIRKAGKLDNAAWVLTPEFSGRILSLAKSSGSAPRGEQIYRRAALQCINCHAIGTAGGLVGPNLISLGGSSQPDYILESLIAPSAKLKEGYTTLSLLTVDGELFNGIAIGKNEESIRLRLADGKEVEIEADAIDQQKPGKSLMPEGALDTLTESELADLVAFLSALGRDAKYTVSTEPMIRSLETLVYSDEANRRLNRTSIDTAASDDPSMQWKPLTTKVEGTIPLDELDAFQQHRETPPTSFVRFNIQLPADGAAKLDFLMDGIAAWVDGKPTPTDDLKAVSFPAGKHTIVLAIDRTQSNRPLAIRLQGDAIEAKD